MKRGLSHLSVLVADPSTHMAELIGVMLRSCRIHAIDEVQSAAAAVSALARCTYDVILLDEALPGTDTLEFVRRLRKMENSPNRLAAVIMMSSAPGSRRIAEARDAGVTEFLRKPFSAQHVESRLLAIRHAPREFVETPAYAGPDRRRREAPVTKERRNGRA